MANEDDKWEDNVGGFSKVAGKKVSFYVDTACIFCNICEDEAPKNFKQAEDETHDICYKQPENEEELQECYIALESCPVDSIGVEEIEINESGD